MSKYHILKNADFHNHFNNDSIATNERIFTDNIENFNKNANNHHLADFDLSNDTNSMNEKHFQNHFFNNEYDKDPYSLKNLDTCVDKTNQNLLNECNDNSSSTGRDIFKYFSTSNFKPLGSVSTGDDYTMEAPLLLQNCNNNNGGDRNNYRNKRFYESECVCLCQQKGFAFNLNNNSTQSATSKILWAVVLCCIFMVVEFLGGYIAGSLAIMTDAAHLASDCISFIIGLVAIWFGCKPPDAKMSFGYKRFEVMGAIVSILGIWILTAALVLVAIQRIYSNDYDLDANTMMTISGIGILINIIMIFILHSSVLGLSLGSIGYSHGHSHSKNHNGHHGHSHTRSHTPTSTNRRGSNESDYVRTEYAAKSLFSTERDVNAYVGAENDSADTCEVTSTLIELSPASIAPNVNLLQHQQDGNEKNLNLRAAMIHVIGDLIQSFAVFLAAVLIKIFPKAVFLDPLCTLLFSIIVIMTTINLFKESMHLMLDSVPQGLLIDDIKMDLMNIEGVLSVHHLNVWNHTSNYSILMAHLVTDNLTDSNAVLLKATQLAGSAKYNIKHSTIQIERNSQ